MAALDVQHVSSPHLVPAYLVSTPTGMRVQAYAAQFPLPGHTGQLAPCPSQATIAERTGIAERTQRSYEQRFEPTELIERVFAVVETDEPFVIGHGYFVDGQGRQRRRLPNQRTPRHHQLGSRSAARRANAQAWHSAPSGGREAGGQRLSEQSPQADRSPSTARQSDAILIQARDREAAEAKTRRGCDYCRSRRSGTCRHHRFMFRIGEPRGLHEVVVVEPLRP